jgi:hypothetical protein
MTTEEKAASDRLVARYDFSDRERHQYESTFRQCLRCESPVQVFREADAADLAQAEGHLVTPVLVPAEAHSHQ